MDVLEALRVAVARADVALCGVKDAIPRAALSLLLAVALFYVVNKSRR